ncbi:MAG: amidase [Pseudomonadota bacterium]
MPDGPDISEILAGHERHRLFAPLDKAALAAEFARPQGAGLVAGRVVGLKANIAVAGATWSAGLPHRADTRASDDAHVTQRLRQEGAQLVPGLNMDAAALGGVTDNPFFGRTDNPRAPGFTAGGSSGGAAAAVASGLLDLALGTDTMGSVRIPASYCGTFGLKPSFGLVGRSGIVPLAPSLDAVGPITASAADLWPLLKTIAGPDNGDADNRLAPAQWDKDGPKTDLSDLKVGIPTAIQDVDCEPDVLQALDRSEAVLARLGARVGTVPIRGWRPAKLRQRALLVTECEGAVCHSEALAQTGTLPATVETLLAYGRDLTPGKMVAALSEMRTARAGLENAFAEVDVLLTPTTPHRAFRADRPAPANQADFTVLSNVAGTPALAVPVPGDPLPCSVQVMGPAWSERQLIGIAMALEKAFGNEAVI